MVEKQLYAGKVPSFPTLVTINGNVLSFCIRNRMSVFDHRPLRTNICKYANLISLFYPHWTIRTMAWTWQKLLCWGATFYV